MSKKTDVRILVSDEYKSQIKIEAVGRHQSVSQMLLDIIRQSIPEKSDNNKQALKTELDEILRQLSNSADMPADEREKLKQRKIVIKKMLEE